MSDSTPAPKPADNLRTKNSAQKLVPPTPTWRQRALSGWWLASVMFHVLLLGWLIFLSPVRVIDLSKKTPTNVSPARARQVMEQIREKQAASLSENLKTLQRIHEELARLETRKREEFKAYAQTVNQENPDQAMTVVLAAQTNSLTALTDGGTKSSLFVRTRANAYFDDLADAQKLARDFQDKTSQAQDHVMELLSMRDDRFVSILNAQKEAIKLQGSAAKALDAAEAARDPARGSRERSEYERQIEHYTYHLKITERDLARIPTNLITLTNQFLRAESALKAVQSIYEQSLTNADSPTARQQASLANQELERRQKALAAAQRKLDDARKSLESASKNLPEWKAKVEALLAETDPVPVSPTLADNQLIELQTNARELQFQAQQAQAKVREAIASFHVLPSNPTNAGQAALAELDKAAATQPDIPAQIQSTNVADIYDASVKLEVASTESYRRFRAMQLSKLRSIPISRALALTDTVKVQRPDLRTALEASVGSGADVITGRNAVQQARDQIGAMVELGSSLLAQAQELDQGSAITPEDTANQIAMLKEMEAAAQDNGDPVDLTGSPGGGGFPGAGGSPGDGGFSGNGGVPGVGSPGSGGAGWFPDDGLGNALAAHAADGGIMPIRPGRRIAAQGPSPKWVFVDSWYILGPFDNTRRANIGRQFPPETIIDLNAVYPGKNGIPIRWEFYQTGKPNIMPPLTGYNALYNKNPELNLEANARRNLQYIIYYAYTELWFEQPCDLWVAIGSDDFSKVWVEDQIIWISGKQLKAWRADEGYRKVHFKAGINRVLYRVENGNDRTEFSFVICLKGS